MEGNSVDVKSSTNENNPYDSKKYRYYSLGLLTTVYACGFIDRQLLAILQESIKLEFSLSDSQLGLLTGFAFAIFYVCAGIPIAHFADKSNRRNILASSIAIWSLMTAISGLAQNYIQLFIARIGVGIGEAGCSPPAHSIIADVFPPEQRATALSFYNVGINIGIMFGFLLGGWLNEVFGWRVAFIAVGLPGIAISIILKFTLKEPARMHADQRAVQEMDHSLKDAVRLLWSLRAFRFIALAAAFSSLFIFGFNSWIAPFMIRSHGLGTAELGIWLALSLGLGGGVGAFAGGYFSDVLARRDQRWYLWLCSICTLLCIPFAIIALLVNSTLVALVSLIFISMLGSVYLAPCLAMILGMVNPSMRAMSSACLFLIINIIGVGLGPWLIGGLSDLLAPYWGVDSLRYAMVILMPVAGGVAMVYYWLGAKSLNTVSNSNTKV